MDVLSMSAADAIDPSLAAFFLDRLARLVARRDRARGREQRVALARSTFSVFLDCCDLGLNAEATAILAGYPGDQRPAWSDAPVS